MSSRKYLLLHCVNQLFGGAYGMLDAILEPIYISLVSNQGARVPGVVNAIKSYCDELENW